MTQLSPLSPRVVALLKKTQATRGRLIFALDATASREPTWDMAAQLQAQMFEEAAQDRRPRHPTALLPWQRRGSAFCLVLRCARAHQAYEHNQVHGRRHQDRAGAPAYSNGA